jgi:SAM-dependent methyltransferase
VEQDDGTRTRSQSFGEIAADYDRFRPQVSEDALDWVVPSGPAQVVELGAGTGLLTRLLLARGLRVQAVEPDPRMREILATRAPGADVTPGQAEELPTPDASVDLVIASSAWHWVDEKRAIPEVARVLRPGGRFSLLWCGPDRSIDWMRSLWAGGYDLTPEEIDAHDAQRRGRHEVDLGAASTFEEPETTVFRWTTPMGRADLIGLAGTYSAVITMETPERQGFLSRMAEYLNAHDELSGREVIDVPMRCLCWRTWRR